jgi:hypothetical protein
LKAQTKKLSYTAVKCVCVSSADFIENGNVAFCVREYGRRRKERRMCDRESKKIDDALS